MQLRGDREEFERRGARVALIGLGTPDRAARFCDDRRIPFDCLTDPSRRAQRAYGVERGGLRRVLMPLRAPVWLRLNARGETRQGRHGEDPMQLGATFVVDRGGVLRWAHRNRDSGDNPPNRAVLAALDALDRP